MNLPADTKISLKQNISLAGYCTMQVGGTADYFMDPSSEEELLYAISFAREENIPYFFLGKGSNTIFPDEGYRGVVISMIHYQNQRVVCDTKKRVITASGGVHLYRLATAARDAGLSGVEFLASIPGTVGGAVMMNAGFSRFPGQTNETADLLKSVVVINEAGEKQTLTRDEIEFSYRYSNLAGKLILEATFQLWRRPKDFIQNEIQAHFDYRNREQDLTHPSSGSIFKNPEKPQPSAGRLIDQCGLKGTRVGGIMVSPRHGNYFIKVDDATSADVVQLIEKVQKVVFDATGIQLEPEVRIISKV